MSEQIIVAVDGPAGSGKSSVSKTVARNLGYDYQDTGAAYRAFGWWLLESGVELNDADTVIAALESFDYQIGIDPDQVVVQVAGQDVSEAIRQPRISAAASASAQIPAVRAYMVQLFRSIIAASVRPGIVVEGRDITTVVCPDAPVRILLTAEESVRAARRVAELTGESTPATRNAMAARDAADSRMVNFTSAADGVVTIDSSELNFAETVAAMEAVILRARDGE
jgi:cytidylate kinase